MVDYSVFMLIISKASKIWRCFSIFKQYFDTYLGNTGKGDILGKMRTIKT